MADTQLDHLGGFIKAALEAATTGACLAYYPYRLPYGAAWTKHPCVELYREKEQIVSRGNNSQRIRIVQVAVNYYAGPVGHDKHEAWAGTMANRVQYVDDAIHTGVVAGYAGGADLFDSAGIEKIEVDSVEYDWGESGGETEDASPMFRMSLTMEHRYTRDLADRTILARIGAEVAAADSDSPAITDEGAAVTADDEGEDGVITAATKRFSSATAAFTTAHVGYYIHISDATNAANNGAHLITARVSGTVVTLGNATGLVNESSLNWALSDTDHDL